MNDLLNNIRALKDRFYSLLKVARIDEKSQEIIKLHAQMAQAGFWSDQEKAKQVSQQAGNLEDEVEKWGEIKRGVSDLLEIAKLDKEDLSVNLRSDIEIGLARLEKEVDRLEVEALFDEKYDSRNAIMAIHAGAGGTDASDWAEMLLRMYLRFAEKKGFKTMIINKSDNEEAGIKSVLFEIDGNLAYGFLKSEAGVHRLVRISPFDAEKMRHTSFALVEVLPSFDDSVQIDINPNDLRIDTYRSGGHGGQNVNTTDSAVRITHLPSGIVVACQNERSQMQNKETAMRILKAKLQKYYETEIEDERKKLRGQFTTAAWGNQARSYVIHPYKLVKYHRTDYETTDVESVLDGNLDELIESYLKQVMSNE